MRSFRLIPAVLLFVLSNVQAQNSVSSPIAVEAPVSKIKKYHDGGIRDLDAIGNRKVGCDRGVGNWYTMDHQIAMGKSYADQVESQSKLINDPVITEYVNRLGQNLVRNSDAQVPFTIKVMDTDDVNAFALPGGFFYVDSGLILAADNEAELAGVMSHEIAHVAACHAARQNTRGQLMNLASIPLIFIGGGVGYAAQNLAGLALPLGFLKFSRGFEFEADYLGLEYMYKAGYDPQAFPTFFEKIKTLEKQRPGFVAKAFETHPQTPDRIRKTQEEINSLLPPRDQYTVDTSEFAEIKERLTALENRHKLNHGESSRPALRRRAAAPGTDADAPGDSSQDKTSGEQGKDKDDPDRPTLKRRGSD